MKIFLPSLLFVLTFIFSSSTLPAQWVRQYPMDKLENVANIAMQADGYGYAVGDNDLILKLDPVEQSWNIVTTWDMNWNLKSVDYVSGANGAIVAAGGQGLILSTNGGANWMEVTGAPANIVDLKITSATEILVAAGSGVFKWSNNTWADLDLPISSGVKGAFILDENHIWVYSQGANPTLYITSNGGNDWSMNTEISSPDVVKFFDNQYGVTIDGRNVYQSLNGGANWTLTSSNEIHTLTQDFAFGENGNVILSATNNGEPSISQDSGKTWTKYDMGTINTKNYSVASVSDTEFWVGNDISSITRTIDGGNTWTETSGPKRSILYETYFINRNTGMSVGSDGAIIRSFDGGTHWEEMELSVPNDAFSVYGLAEDDVWVGANKGIFHTTDMGETWTEKLSFLGGSANSIVAISANRIFATTSTGFLLRSTDGGSSWDTAYTAASQLRSVTKIDDQRLMATGYNGLILKSVDQGGSWFTITPPEANLQYEETQFLGEEGWMVTSSFKKVMWHSNNAGDTWTPIDLPIERFWEGVHFISPDTGVVVGRNNLEGRVYITYDGGQSWQGGHITSYPIYDVTGKPNPNGTAWISGFGSDIEVLPNCNALPVISDFMGDLSPCQGDTVLYTISAQDVSQFFWIFPPTWAPIGSTNNDSVWVIAGPVGNNISVTGSSPCGISETINQAVEATPLPNFLEISGEENPCEGSSITYNASALSALQYIWSFPSDWTITTDPMLGSVTVEVGKLSGDISVQAANDCGVSGPEILTVNTKPLPIVSNVIGESEPCQGSVVTYTAEADNADSFVWSIPSDWQVTGELNEAMVDVLVGAEVGDVTVVGQNTCGISPATVYSVAPKPAPPVSIIRNENMLSLSTTGVSYQWYMNGEIIDGATEDTFTATVSGVYHAIVAYDNGCQSTTPQLAVIVTSTGDVSDIMSISTYPNPVSNDLYLRDIEGTYRYQIFDFAGQTVTTGSTAKPSVRVSDLSNGVYIIRIEQNDQIYQARFVVLK